MPSSPNALPDAPRAGRHPRVVCTIPTFNEAGNILELARAILSLDVPCEVLVIDDDSPDGTWKLVREAAAGEPRLHLLHRRQDKGRGRSGRDGFRRALELGAEVVIEMDADFSHQPRYIPDLIQALGGPEGEVGLVLGSRAVSGGMDADRGWTRRLITRLANLYIRLVLGVRVHDCNSGFRCWRRSTLERIRADQAFSAGPAIVQELLYKTARAGIAIAEVPIEFNNRLHGESTLTLRTLMQGYTAVLRLRWLGLTGRL